MLYYLQSQAVSGRREGNTMAININDITAVRKLTIEDLLNDTVERQDYEAYEWLDRARHETAERKKKDGTVETGKRTLQSIRSEYLQKFLGYKPKTKANKKDNEDKLFEEARKKFKAMKK